MIYFLYMPDPIVTEKSFYKYLKCPAWIARELEDDQVQDRLLTMLQDDGLLKHHTLELLKERDVVTVEASDDVDEMAQKTLELMREGEQGIVGGVLTHGRWVAKPDVLERVEGKSLLGDWYYVAVDVKRSSRLKDEYLFQGVFYAEILFKLQGVRPVKGYVMHESGAVSDYMIQDHYTEFHMALDDIEAILDGEKPEHFLTSGYKQSPYFYEFLEEVQACDHLSLLNRVWKSEVSALERASITTVTQLADASMDDLQEVKGVSMDRLYFLQQQAISQKENRVITIGTVELESEPDVALVIDIESDPMRNVDYLFGVLVVDGTDETYHQFLAKTPEEEESNWQEFVRFLEEYSGANIYHYGWYEVDVFRKLVQRYGAPESVKTMFEEQMIDLLGRLRGHVIFPMPFYSLKDVAKFIGFKWRTKDASGPDSVIWYEEWIQHGNEESLRKTIEYNEDDVRATWELYKWAMDNVV